ncbi:hypothetical protein RND71_014557 [Anisodus tanguticus]|uniref:Uncharacterized protein n=1 Tax=Anisodus tanguticus TaxID=243964 RepID=A0AAE1SC00_9SOLA|nr:hypothetical protein RND71_014557 [Anisodus tanguticus]
MDAPYSTRTDTTYIKQEEFAVTFAYKGKASSDCCFTAATIVISHFGSKKNPLMPKHVIKQQRRGAKSLSGSSYYIPSMLSISTVDAIEALMQYLAVKTFPLLQLEFPWVLIIALHKDIEILQNFVI